MNHQTDHLVQAQTQTAHPGQIPVRPRAIIGQHSVRRAMGSVLVAIALLTLMDAGIKYWTGTFGTVQILFMRYVAGFVVAALIAGILLARGLVSVPSRGSIVRALQRSVIILGVAACFFYSLSVIPLAEATAIAFTAPIYIAILGWFILKEPVAPSTWLAILVGLAGVAIISSAAFVQQDSFSGALSGYVTAALAALLYASALVLTRLHAASDPVPVMIMLQSGFAATLAIPLMVLVALGFSFDGRALIAPSTADLWLALGIGCLGTVGHLFMASGFKHAPAAKLGPMEYTSLLWAGAYGFFFFGEIPSVRLLFGCILIVAGTWIVMREEARG